MAEKFIQKMHLKKGALHRQLGIPIGQKIPEKTLEKAAHAPGKLGRRARVAETLKGLPHHKVQNPKTHGGKLKHE